jgi:hypothetical protein
MNYFLFVTDKIIALQTFFMKEAWTLGGAGAAGNHGGERPRSLRLVGQKLLPPHRRRLKRPRNVGAFPALFRPSGSGAGNRAIRLYLFCRWQKRIPLLSLALLNCCFTGDPF